LPDPGSREGTSGMGGEVEACKRFVLVLLFEGQEWAGFRTPPLHTGMSTGR